MSERASDNRRRAARGRTAKERSHEPYRSKFIRYQGPVLRGMGEAAVGAFKQRLGQQTNGNGRRTRRRPCRDRSIASRCSPRPADLVRDYVRHVGGDPASYKGRVPAHLFPQWGFPLRGADAGGLPYPLLAVMNGGCKLEINARLPAGEPLEVLRRASRPSTTTARAPSSTRSS